MPNCSYYRRPTRILSYGLFLTICSLFSAQGQVALAHIFSDHMVLQREQPIKIWGWATAGEAIEVSMASQSATTTANSQGNWEVILKALPAGGPHEVSIKGKNTIELKDVLVGDLWLASGQSNMEWRISSTPFTETDSTLLHENQIRLFTVQIETDYLPRNDVKGGIDIIEALAEKSNFLKSKGEARRALKENSISVNREKVSESYLISEEDLINDRFILLQRGRKNYFILSVV